MARPDMNTDTDTNTNTKADTDNRFDLLIENGLIVDGTGLPGYRGNVAVRAGKIVEMGRVRGSATRTIDATDRVVCPGFIDFHTHLDPQLVWDPSGAPSCWHGVTTVIAGNCSLGLAPCKDSDRDALKGMFARIEAISRAALDIGLTWSWTTVSEYLQAMDRAYGVNVGLFVGHSPVRQFVMGEASSDRPARADEISAMQAIVREALDAGALGLSTSRSPKHRREDGRPTPSAVASHDELRALCSVLGEVNAGVTQIVLGRIGVDVGVDAAMEVFRELARVSGRPVLWLKLAHFWTRPEEWRQLLDAAASSFRDGLPCYALAPALPKKHRFTLENTQLFDTVLAWRPYFLEMSMSERLEALADPAVRRMLEADAADVTTPRSLSWDLVYIKQTKLEEHRDLCGMRVADLAARRGVSIIDAFLDLALAEHGQTEFETVTSGGDEAAMKDILTSPYTLVGLSDAGAHTIFEAAFGYCTHLLGRYVRELGVMSVEAAVRELTLVPARVLELGDRGMLRPGFAADITIFDLERIAPREPELRHDYPGGQARLIQQADGIAYTVVNGEIVVENGHLTDARPGRLLRNPHARQRANSQSRGGQ